MRKKYKKIGTDRLCESMLVRVISANLFDRFTRPSSFAGHSEAVDLTYNKYTSFVIEINNTFSRSSECSK